MQREELDEETRTEFWSELLVGLAPTGVELCRAIGQRWIARCEEKFGRKPFANVALMSRKKAQVRSLPESVLNKRPSYLLTIPYRSIISQPLRHPSTVRACRSYLRA